ncbi:MAG: alanine racemase, partial [Bacteroidaceae bacterium]|nr:alanine racemase [Bacteroidaceae bacterium]
MNYNLKTIASLMGAHCMGSGIQQIDWLLTDSRSLCFPESTLFFALQTARDDGHRYIPELYRRGVRAFVVTAVPEGDLSEATFLVVPNTLQALQRLAERHRDAFDIPVIGITGSNGKTTVKEWLYQLLSPDRIVTRSPRSYNSQIGVPLSVWSLNAQSQLAIFEAGISQPDEMAALQRIIQPTIGIFTCLGQAHQENFSSLHEKCREKLLLFRDAQVIFYPDGDPLVGRMLQSAGYRGRLIPWHSSGDAMQDNRNVCAAVCRYLGMDDDTIEQRIKQLEPVAMRLEVKQGERGCTLIDDAYNSDLDSLNIALDFMARRAKAASGSGATDGRMPCTLIVSDIAQSGMVAWELYHRVARMAVSRGVTQVLAVGSEICSCRECFVEAGLPTLFFSDTNALMRSDAFARLHDTIILLKGARAFHFEQVADRLEQKVHETILEVNLNAVVENLNYYRSFLNRDTKMVCMVKADAYGAGAVEVARTLQDARVDYLAVAVADEGATLRQAGITSNIMVMNPEMSSFRTLFRYNLEPEVYNFRLLDALVHAAESEGVTDLPVHIKLDTGMHRLGFHPIDDMPRLVESLLRQTAVIPRSVFSHFVGSDSDAFDDFSALQYQLFMQGADTLQQAFPHHILRHICNSAGITHFPERQQDMVRLGLGLYGINSRDNSMLANVSTLRTTILQLRDVPAGDTIGYSRRTVLDRPSRIATLPIGYADGLNRRLGNRAGYCLVAGHPAPYVGNICMDVCMVDVTDIPCREGDTAIIFGEQLS